MIGRGKRETHFFPISWKIPDHFPKHRGSQKEAARGQCEEFSMSGHCEGLLAMKGHCPSALTVVPFDRFP